MLWPRTSMSICSYKLGSQGESSKETTNIAMCCSRWCHLCHRFQSLQDFCCCFSVPKNLRLNREPWLERPQRTRCFLRFAHLGLYLDVLGFKEIIWYLLFASDIFWRCLVVGCFEGFVSPSMPGASPWPNPTEDAPYLNAENNIMEASPEELASCSLAFHKVAMKGLKMVKNDTF